MQRDKVVSAGQYYHEFHKNSTMYKFKQAFHDLKSIGLMFMILFVSIDENQRIHTIETKYLRILKILDIEQIKPGNI